MSILRSLYIDNDTRNPKVKGVNEFVNNVGSLQPASVIVDARKNYRFSGSGSLDGAMTLVKTNRGTLTINTTNNFTGATTVSNGTLLVHGALNASAITVRSGGTIGGNGILGNSVTVSSGATRSRNSVSFARKSASTPRIRLASMTLLNKSRMIW